MRNPVPRLLLLAALLAFAPAALAPAVLAQEASADLAAETAAPAPAPDAPSSGSSVGSVLSPLPGVSLTKGDEDLALPIQLLLLLTVLTLAPSVIILMTSFTRLIVIFSILRTALGMQQSPPTQIIIGLALFLTFFIMAPVIEEVNTNALEPYLAEKITQSEALALAAAPTKAFMLEQTRDKDLMLFMDMGGLDAVATPEEVPLHVLVPAFVISELRIAFQIGFMLFLPFLIVDLIVASVLMSMGMMMLPPVMISLPIKLLLFVLTDGWYLIVESVVRGYLG
ncbi:MAG: flagellar type III secretion system pore protein FliP [Rhodothermales bacterium]